MSVTMGGLDMLFNSKQPQLLVFLQVIWKGLRTVSAKPLLPGICYHLAQRVKHHQRCTRRCRLACSYLYMYMYTFIMDSSREILHVISGLATATCRQLYNYKCGQALPLTYLLGNKLLQQHEQSQNYWLTITMYMQSS